MTHANPASTSHLNESISPRGKAMTKIKRFKPAVSGIILFGTTALVCAPAFAQGTVSSSGGSKLIQTSVDANISDAKPMLNAGLAHGGFNVVPGQPVTFRSYWNYDRSIDQAVIRIFNASDEYLDEPIASIPVSKERSTVWTPPRRAGAEYVYVLRVFDTSGKYDETKPRALVLSNASGEASEIAPSSTNIYRQDNTAVRNIDIKGYLPKPAVSYTAPVTARKVVRPSRPAPQPKIQVRTPTPPSPKPVPQADAMRIYVEGAENVTQTNRSPSAVDAALSAVDIQMTYDGLSVQPLLNVGIDNDGGAAAPGQTIDFVTYWNYAHWIKRADIRVFDAEDQLVNAPIVVLPVSEKGKASWTVPAGRTTSSYTYVLRIYNTHEQWDETNPKTLNVSDRPTDAARPESQITAIYGNDNTAIRNIAVRGATVTVSGKSVVEGGASNVRVFDRPVKTDEEGDFAVRQILPPGEHAVDISYVDGAGSRVDIIRDIDIPKDDWFLVAIGDLTIGTQSDDSRAIIEAGGEDFDETFVTGRAAFYLKGKIKGEYLLTASLDTTEENIDNLFSNLDKKNPQSLLRRIDPDRYYPVYGDDSTYYDDAPTQGRFFVRLERGDDEVVWGNFLTNITDTEFSQIDRGLYGAKVEYNSDVTTSFGERRAKITAFAADPGTIPAREEYRGTGGSVYFLENQDITIGSERLRVEVRDRESGLVSETRDLKPFVDYEIDYIQGRVLLARPLSSTQLDNRIVRSGTLSGEDVYLVSRYEFTPTLGDLDGWTTGGRVEGWAGDHIRLGVTAQEEETAGADQTLIAADVVVRASEDTYIKAEIAQSDGAGFTERASLDGGFTYDTLTAGVGDDATAYRVEGATVIGDTDGAKARVNAYYENIEEGFSGVGRLTQDDTQRYGAEVLTEFGADQRIELGLKLDEVDIENRLEETTVSTDLRVGVTDTITAGIGLRYNDVDGSLVGRDGDRTDLGVELKYEPGEDFSIYTFAQDTIDSADTRKSGTRYGIGGSVQVTDQLDLTGEVSGGAGGSGALAGLNWQRKDGEEYYLNYTLDAERTEPGIDGNSSFLGTSNTQNTLTVGGRKRFNDYLSVYGEERASFGDTSGLTNAFGVDISPDDNWVVGASVEVGDVESDGRVVEREAYTATVGYVTEPISGGAAIEWRDDDENGISRETWLFRSNLGVQVSPDWRALLKYNKAESNSGQGAFFAGEFTEAQVAGAYRPTENDRLNALVRYTYFEDLPGAQQISNSGQTGLPAQKSNIFSVDGQYRLNDWLTIGGKYGLRKGEVSLSRLDEDFLDSTATLGVIRADVHFIKKWDAVLEGRILEVEEAQDTRSGVLAALYRHVGDNAKVGIGYNFTDFSDDLTDLSYDDDGVFLNIIAKF